MKKTVIVLICTSLLLLPGDSFCQDFFFSYDVPYVPTPVGVVEEMLEMAQVGPDDILYDLGCGDGRIIVMAAEKYGTSGVGFDIDPQRITESRKNAFNANVIGKVRFYEKDFFLTDISEATVLTLYLLTSVNLKLRPKILRELKPGTRVVSHNYAMGEWMADQSKDIGSHTVYFWVVPSNVSGTWELNLENAEGEKQSVIMFYQQYQYVSGVMKSERSQIPIKDVKLTGNNIQFTFEEVKNGNNVTMQFAGLINVNTIEGSIITVTDPDSTMTRWRAERDPSTIIPLDK